MCEKTIEQNIEQWLEETSLEHEKTLEQWFEETAEDYPINSINELDLHSTAQLYNVYTHGDTVGTLYDRLRSIYEHVPNAELIKAAQYNALYFLYLLKKETNERAGTIFYKRDPRGFWETETFQELASKHCAKWEALALWDALFATSQIGESITRGLDHIEEAFLDAHDAAGIFVTSEKPDDFGE